MNEMDVSATVFTNSLSKCVCMEYIITERICQKRPNNSWASAEMFEPDMFAALCGCSS